MTRVFVSAAILSLSLIGAAQAQTTGTATTDLNIRSGPGPEQPVIGLIKARQQTRILGCIEGSLWCQVDFRGQIGWAYSQYMSLAAGSGTIVVREPAHIAGVPIITYNPPGAVMAPTYRPEYIPPPPPFPVPGPTVVGPGGAGAGAMGAPDPMATHGAGDAAARGRRVCHVERGAVLRLSGRRSWSAPASRKPWC